jgi:Zn-finger nucleic acid-binding protein
MHNQTCGCAKGATFERHKPAEGLHTRRCTHCLGVLLLLKDYRVWRDRHFSSLPTIEPHPMSGQEQSSKARFCPLCQHLMGRYRTGDAASFWLDYCPTCDAVWLDDGEWVLLEKSGFAPYLDTLLTERWQKLIQSKKTLSYRDERLRARFGEETLAEIQRIKTWLDAHPRKKELLAYLVEHGSR